jgi:hypothetical protein
VVTYQKQEMSMKKTIEEMRAAVITQLVAIRDEIDYRGVKRLEWLSVEVVKFDMLSVCVFDKPYAIKLDGDIDPILLRLLYSGLGLEARDAANEVSDFLYIDINRLKDELKDSEAKNAALVEALEEIKAEFNRLKSNAKSLRDAVYLDGVLAVIESISGKLLDAHKEGGAKG